MKRMVHGCGPLYLRGARLYVRYMDGNYNNGNHERRSRTEIIAEWVRNSINYSFSRSGGAGGQNVNKVNSKVTATLPLTNADVFTAEEIARIHQRLENRINANDELVIQAQEERSQLRNREVAEERTVHLILSALRTRRPRKPTRPSRASQEARLREKRLRGEKKHDRGWNS